MKTYEEYLKESGNVHLAYYVEAADILGIKYTVVQAGTVRFEYEDRHWFIMNAVTSLTNSTGATISKRKNMANMVLKANGIDVPQQEPLSSPIDAIKFFHKYKNIVIKPTQQLGGKGITLLPETEEQVISSFEEAQEMDRSKSYIKVLGEEFIKGENYRFLVVGEKVVGIVWRKAPVVIGNSKNTIRELIDARNKERKLLVLMPIAIDSEVETRLKNANLTLESIPEEGQIITLRYNCNLSTGGTTEECASIVDPYYKELAVRAVKALDLEFGGVDIIAEDITKKGKCGINEVNYNPGLRLHYKVDKGESVKVAIPIMEYMRDRKISLE